VGRATPPPLHYPRLPAPSPGGGEVDFWRSTRDRHLSLQTLCALRASPCPSSPRQTILPRPATAIALLPLKPKEDGRIAQPAHRATHHAARYSTAPPPRRKNLLRARSCHLGPSSPPTTHTAYTPPTTHHPLPTTTLPHLPGRGPRGRPWAGGHAAWRDVGGRGGDICWCGEGRRRWSPVPRTGITDELPPAFTLRAHTRRTHTRHGQIDIYTHFAGSTPAAH